MSNNKNAKNAAPNGQEAPSDILPQVTPEPQPEQPPAQPEQQPLAEPQQQPLAEPQQQPPAQPKQQPPAQPQPQPQPPAQLTPTPQQQATASDISPPSGEIREDDLASQEKDKTEVETRAQRLASDLVEQKFQLQGSVFSVAMVVICAFYFFFLITVMRLVCDTDHALFKKEFPATATVLIGMLGSIPTILMAFLMSGLFKEKEAKDKDKDEKSAVDAATLAKIVAEVIKVSK